MLRAVIMALLGPAIASAQQTMPVLRYQPPANWYRSASTNPEQYSSNEANAGTPSDCGFLGPGVGD